MKRIIAISFALICCFVFAVVGSAQSRKWVYCEAVPSRRAFKTDVSLLVNYGQVKKTSDFSKKVAYVRDSEGKVLNFCNRVEALNWLSEKGWEFCSSDSLGNIKTWILKHNVEGLTDEQIQDIYSQFNIRQK